ncbi:bacteriochlorophyll 4-vinyl reductase [Terribacillus saccharophilus]|uniref:bacteriochlorophyll 4-vinyl reductase n=1 Tax=Terribacillus saccharophilus TaxID=361277 RepID=UPI0039823999
MAESTSVELIISNALKLPGVKVNRNEFLAKTLADQISADQLKLVLEKGPIEANISSSQLKRIAKSIVEKRTLQTSTASFAAGLPGGVAMAATIPADTIQFFGVALRLAQELAYLYGYKDMWQDNQIDMERVKGELILFLGVMFGVGGSASILKVFSSKLSQQILKKLPQKALTKTLIYPIVKKIAAMIGVKMTKDSFAKSFAKVVPVLGGVVSGGLTYTSMKKMGNRLNDVFYESMTYSGTDLKNDFNQIKKEMPEIIDADFIELENKILNKS